MRDDSGFAMLTVVLMSTIIFLLATTVLVLMAYRTSHTTLYTQRNQAMHIADAGLNEYMYRLSANGYDYWKDNPELGPLELEGGTWNVTAEEAGELIRLRSEGTLNTGQRRVVNALVRFPTFADYAWVLGTGNITFGATTVVDGKVRINGNIYNSGTLKKKAYACGTGKRCYSGSSSAPKAVNYPGGWQDGALPTVDFTKISTDIAKLKATAQAENTYYPASGAKGYVVTLAGSTVIIEKILTLNLTYSSDPTKPKVGEMTLDSPVTIAVPASGVIFFDDNVYPKGTYGSPVTLATSKDMVFIANLTRGTGTPKAVCGLVAQGKTTWPMYYVQMPTDLTVEAAILAQTGTIGFDAPSSYNSTVNMKRNDLTLRGSLSAAGGNTGFYRSDLSAGFIGDRQYLYDPALYDDPPPLFPQLRGDNLRVTQWLDE